MTDVLLLASKGCSKSKGGLNIGDFKDALINIFPNRRDEINVMKRYELEFIAREYFYNESRYQNKHMQSNYSAETKIKYQRAPLELLRKYLLYQDHDQIRLLCRFQPDFAKICEDDSFWEAKIAHDYGETIPKWGNTWEDTWINIENM